MNNLMDIQVVYPISLLKRDDTQKKCLKGTIFQTSSLQGLSIVMDDLGEFSADAVISWFTYTRDTLRSLVYNARSTPNVNILDKCGRQKLETLALAYNSIVGVEPSYQRFPCLRSLSLRDVRISALDLNLLLTACPKIESFSLLGYNLPISDPQATMELNSPTLKHVLVHSTIFIKFVLEADNLESLSLKDSTLNQFELVGKGTLKKFEIDRVSGIHLDIGENADNLEVVDVSNFTFVWPKFYQMISKSSKLRRLRLWGVVFDHGDEIVDLETVAVCFPQLRHLSLSYDGVLHDGLQGTSQLENVLTLELGWNVISKHFYHWVAGMLGRCPNVKRLVIHGVLSDAKAYEQSQILANFTSCLFRLMRKYVHVEVQFEYETRNWWDSKKCGCAPRS